MRQKNGGGLLPVHLLHYKDMVDAIHTHHLPIENHNIHKNVQISMSHREKTEEYDLLYRLSRCNER